MIKEKHCCENPEKGYQAQGMTSAVLRYGCQSCQKWTGWYKPTKKQTQDAWDERRRIMKKAWEEG